MERISIKTKKITVMGLMLAMTVVLSMIEHALPPIPLPYIPPTTRIGLANVIVMYTLFFLGRKYAVAMALLKSLFVGMTRGAQAGFMSLCGGLVSLGIMIVVLIVSRNKASYVLVSIFGAIGHNFGQMLGASLEMKMNLVGVYWPILLAGGVVFGGITGVLLGVIIPQFNRIIKLKPTIERAKSNDESGKSNEN